MGAYPEPGARVEVSPGQIQLNFTEPLNPRLTSVRVVALTTGESIDATHRSQRPTQLVISPGALPTGAYRITWHTVSTEDGHALEGSFSFGVRAPAAGAEHALVQSPFARNGWVRVLLRVLFYPTVLLFVAALLLPRLLPARSAWLAPAGAGDEQLIAGRRARSARLTEALGWLAVSAAIGVTLADTANAAGSVAPGALGDYLLTNLAGGARLAVVVLLAAAALFWRRWPRLAGAAGIAALGAVAVSGHAGSASPRGLSIVNDWVHLVSGAAWVGGIGLLALVWTRPLRTGDAASRALVAQHVLAPFGRVALPAFVIVSLTGLVSLVTQLGSISALWQTGYGRLLMVKIVLVGAIAAASALHALRLRPRLLGHALSESGERRHWRLVRAEPILGLAVVGVVAVLVAFPLPPRQLLAAAEAQPNGAVCEGCPLPSPGPDELAVATRSGKILVAGWLREQGGEVTGTLRVTDRRGQPSDAPLRIQSGAELSACGLGCWRVRLPPGTDTLRARVTADDQTHEAVLPARWIKGGDQRARDILESAERTMRALDSVRQTEVVTSGPGEYARTRFRLRAPDRMAFSTDRGVRAVVVGKRRWLRTGSSPWSVRPYGSGLAFRTRSWFRWTVYARAVRLLEISERGGRRVAELALFDEGTPVWIRVNVDLASRRVVGERINARVHTTTVRYFDYDRPGRILAPEGVHGG